MVGSEPSTKSEPGSASQGQPVTKGVGRRGMHSATGAYWNNEKDGMWSFKYEEAAGRGMDVVVSVIWIAI
jgi:dynein light chain Tctex-type 1